MLASRRPKFLLRISPWCVAVCLLLAVLFLYNPFFTIYGSSAVRSVGHPLSLRGTVASSELRRSVVTRVQPRIDALDEAELDAVRHPRASCPILVALPGEPLRSKQEAVLESLWFRPPPIL
jgi:hypothetical protein